MPREALGVAVRADHGAGLKFAAHCHGFDGSRLAVEAGVDSIEHGTYVDQATLELMAALGTYMVPTISTWDRLPWDAREQGNRVLTFSGLQWRQSRESGIRMTLAT